MDKVLFLLILISIAVGQLVQIPVFGRDMPILDIAVMIAVLIGGYRILTSGKYRKIWELSIFRVFLVLISVLFLSLVVNFNNFPIAELLLSSLFWVRFVAYGLLAFIFFAITDKHNLDKFKQWLIWLFVGVATLGFVQLGLFPSLEIWEHLGWDPHQGRLFSTFLDPNYVGVFLSLGLGFTLIFHPKVSKDRTYVGYLLSIALIGLAILFTFSRTALLVTATIVAIVTIFRKRQLFWIGLGLAVIILAVSPRIQGRILGAFSLDDTTIHRLESYRMGVEQVISKPIIGVGYNTLSFREDAPTTGRADSGFDGSLLTITATSGLLGLLAFLWFIGVSLKSTWHGLRNKKLVFNFWFVVSTAGLFIGSFFINAWLYPPLMAMWFMILGLSLKENG